MNLGVVSYVLAQYQDICFAHSHQLKDLQLLAKSHESPFFYIVEYLQMEQHLKFLLKKINHHLPFSEAF